MSVKTLDPRSKFAIILTLSTMALVYVDLWKLSMVLLLSLILTKWLTVDLIMVFKHLKKLIGAVLIIAFFQSAWIKTGAPLIQVLDLVVLTDYGLTKALEFMIRMAIVILSSVILSTSSSRQIVQGLIQIGVPYEIAFMVSIGIRFLPIFKEEMTDALIALQLRGIDLNKVKFGQKLKVYQYLLMPVVTGALQKARALAITMEMRGFRAKKSRTSYKPLKLNSFDIMCISVSIIGLLLLWVTY